ncbi:MAG TPA: amidohydrolase family protein [Candidatus Eisenbacteria bacterium]|nr:amidohydrolase family protein [Candidatus Eisenbacteria bacterium]
MKPRSILIAIVLCAAVSGVTDCVFAQQSARVAPADILIVHGKVYTLDPAKPWAQAVAIRRGKIEAVGRDEEVERYRGIGTKWVDAGGKLVLPGFTDCHVHFLKGSLALGRVNLEGAKDVADLQERLREYAGKHPGDDWILGRGWNYAMFGSTTLPNRKYLDELFPDRPVFLEGYDGHTYWVNSKALALAGITRGTPNPPNGAIVRDPQTGEATGALKEAPAGALVRRVIPAPTHVETLVALRAGIKWANQNGFTRVHSAGGDFEILPVLEELRQEKQLTLRFHVAYLLSEYRLDTSDLEKIEVARKRYRDEWIDANSVKFMLDGVVESHTAALLAPYADEPSQKGALFWDPEQYTNAVAELDKRNVQIYTHAIGDYAVRTALDAYEFAEKKNHTRDHWNRVEHIETISPEDIPRFGKLGVIASMQPLHSYPDEDTLDIWARNLGPDRASRAWMWKSIHEAGGRYAFGSDWPIVTINPWQGMQTAVTRQTAEGTPKEGFVPLQRFTVAEAVEGYTLDAAYAGRREKWEGSIAEGKLGDVIVVDRNIFEIDPHSIGETKVVMTIVGGKIVYEADTN